MIVSLVIPVYNGEKVLTEQLDALVAQSQLPAEVVIADNGSTDSSARIAATYADRLPLRIVDVSERRGNAAARNLGAAAAGGDVLLFLDQDDVADEHWVEQMVRALDGADLVMGANHVLHHWPPKPPYSAPADSTFPFLPYGLSCNMGVRRGAFDALGGFDETYQAATDLDLCFRSQLAGHRFAIARTAEVYKRTKESGAFRQHAEFGWDDVLLYRRFRTQGMQRDSALKRYAWLGTRVPQLRHHQGRRRWVRVAGRCWGRATASVRLRVFCP